MAFLLSVGTTEESRGGNVSRIGFALRDPELGGLYLCFESILEALSRLTFGSMLDILPVQ